jgi:hypothetical protein
MILKVELPITADMRKEICDRASEVAGGFIETIGQTDFGEWNQATWDNFIGAMFDVIAADVFTRRVVVIPPCEVEYQPPY